MPPKLDLPQAAVSQVQPNNEEKNDKFFQKLMKKLQFSYIYILLAHLTIALFVMK